MRVSQTVPTHGISSPKPPASRFARWSALVAVAMAVSAGVTLWTGAASYEARLVDIVAERALSADAYDAARESPVLKQLFLSSAGDRDLTLKLELALTRYPDPARRVLEEFGGNVEFQRALLEYGEGVLPVIDYFINTDVATLWAKGKLEEVWKSISSLWEQRQAPAAGGEALVYGPRLRGIYAIEAIRAEGHHFLGQFVLGNDGKVQRVQTDRLLETFKTLFLGGTIELETKFRKGEALALPDFAWAGVDILSAFGVFKAVKYLGKASAAGKAAEEAAVVRRTSMMGRSVLLGEALGKRVVSMGAKVAAVYLVLRHPSLLSGVFVALGKLFSWPAWWSVAIGWGVVSLIAMPVILFLIRGLTLLIAPIRWLAGAAAWVLPGRSQMVIAPTSARRTESHFRALER